jgi:uncharacterized membrane protein YbhN (UPF0104 family)
LAPAGNNKKIRNTVLVCLKISVSAVLLYLIFSKAGGKAVIANLRLLNPIAFIAASGIYLSTLYLSSLRWRLLIPRNTGLKRIFSFYMIGAFFNTCTPGIIGGDAVKAYYLHKELSARSRSSTLSIAIASVFMDRYIGFFALLTISIIVFPFGFKYLEETPVKWLMPALLLGFAAGSILIFKFRIGERLKFLFKVYEYFSLYRSKRRELSMSFLYSLCIQLLNILSVYILSQSLSLGLSFLSLVVFVPIIVLISFIPVSISGIGLREGAFVFFLGTLGVASELSVTLSISWFLSIVFASLPGLFPYLRFKTVLDREEKEEPL